MQTITDFIVVDQAGTLLFISHRNNAEHITTGASASLVWQGIAETRTTKQLTAWVGDNITVTDYYGTRLFEAVVKAKSVREWDMSKPVGQRLHSQKKSKQWDTVYNTYRTAIIQKRGW